MLQSRPFNSICVLVIMLPFMLMACSSSTSSEGDAAIIQGSVGEPAQQQSYSNKNMQAGTVTAARISSDGSFSAIHGAETQLNASGEFTLEVDANEAAHIAILSQTEAGEFSGFLSAHVQNGQTYRMKPLSTKSTAETKVYARVVASGNADIVQKADVQTVVSEQAAVSIHANAALAGQYASSLSNTAEARVAFVAEFAEGNTTEILNAAAELRAEAQFEFEATLHSGVSAQQREAAFESFLEASAEAYVMAGMDIATVAKQTHMYKRVFLNSMSSASEQQRNEARANNALFASIAIDMAVRADAEVSGMSEATIQAIAEAGTQLRTDVKASAGAGAEVETAFESYHEQVRESMENDASVEASVITAIDTEINVVGGPKVLFNTALSGSVSASVVANIYSTYVNSVYSIAETRFDSSTELDTEAMARLMLLINLTS